MVHPLLLERQQSAKKYFNDNSYGNDYLLYNNDGNQVYFENYIGDFDIYDYDLHNLIFHYDFWEDGDISFMNIIVK